MQTNEKLSQENARGNYYVVETNGTIHKESSKANLSDLIAKIGDGNVNAIFRGRQLEFKTKQTVRYDFNPKC